MDPVTLVTSRHEQRRGLAYAVTVAVVALATLARLALNPIWGPHELAFFTFYPAIVVAAYLGGLAPGIVATLLGAAVAAFFWLQPTRLLVPVDTADRLALVLFVGMGALISALGEALHHARRAEARTVRALTEAQEERAKAQQALARHAARLAILHDIDHAIINEQAPGALAAAVLPRLRELLGVPRAIVNIFDLEAGEVEWLAAMGRHRLRMGPGVRFPLAFMGDVEALRRGEPQIVDITALPRNEHVDALRASGVLIYMVIPMLADGELIGALSFGGATADFLEEQVGIAREAAAQIAIGLAHARLHERVTRQAAELEQRVRERTAALEAAQADLVRAERLAILGKLAGGVSHELRNPLGVIKNALYYLRMILPPDEKVLKHLAILDREATTANRIVTSLLDFARVVPPNRIPVDLVDLVRDCLAEARLPEQIVATVDAAPDALPVRIDPHQVRLVIGNLLSNAAQAMPEGGRLAITVAPERDGRVTLAVEDSGVGIPSENLEKIFEPLFSTKVHGIGFGLAVVKGLSEANGATVTVQSTVGVGSRFAVTFDGQATGGSL